MDQQSAQNIEAEPQGHSAPPVPLLTPNPSTFYLHLVTCRRGQARQVRPGIELLLIGRLALPTLTSPLLLFNTTRPPKVVGRSDILTLLLHHIARQKSEDAFHFFSATR